MSKEEKIRTWLDLTEEELEELSGTIACMYACQEED